jgi:hypothetical protein
MNTKDLIRALGGAGKVAAECGVGLSAVSNWTVRGIPAEHHLTIWRMAAAAGLAWAPPGMDGVELVLPAPAAEAAA